MTVHAGSGAATGYHGIDGSGLLELFDGDADLLREVIEMFRAHCPILIAELRDAIVWRDAERLEHAAHSLKGSVANFGATPAVDAARSLERMGMQAQLDGVEEVFAHLQQSMYELELGLQQLVAEM